ncbi:nucleoside triphosphate pyrophosphohydrolase family protein [Rhabdochromatium marinum]|uniref:nucleoside triphosphate pyrophosphohydrolase family protein n=1 Tax=Rhabdochromatium marinum TaxID=48729 RepID=UPI0019071B94|nr:nucleoside triphosphate pyrophosphohydrolase family protein [Rhabdochromatium marinum]MBK1647477.1 pyrophosphatase [Rhabdochromatium marinum]
MAEKTVNPDSYDAMLAAVQAFHDKHHLRETGGEDLVYRIALMAEELGEISASVTKGRPYALLAEEIADLTILLLGTAIAADVDLKTAFWQKMAKLDSRKARMVNGRIRVSAFEDDPDPEAP